MITERQIVLVKSTWNYVILRSQEAGETFYQRLFEIAPHLKPMFKGNTKEQARKLMSMVTLIVTKLEKLDDIMQEIKYLAIRHVKYQVEEKHYDLVGQSLLWTLENGLKDKWTNEVAEAWTKVYTILSNAMITTMQKEKENVLLK